MPRHSAGGVGSSIHTYAMRMWHSKSFAVYVLTRTANTCIIRTMNTKHACSVHLLYILYCIHTGFLAPNCTQDYKLALNTAWRPYKIRWLFTRSICTSNKRNSPTEGFHTQAQTCCFYSWVYQPTYPSPTLSAHIEPISQGYHWKWHHIHAIALSPWHVICN